MRIYTAKSRGAKRYKPLEITWDEFKNKLRNPVRTEETRAEYAKMTNEQKTDIKDVGGYVGGELRDGRRTKDSVINRCLLIIDDDHPLPNSWELFQLNADDVTCCAHTTHTSTKDAPRLRWIFPLKRPVNTEEYRVLAAQVMTWIGSREWDASTDQPERMMFWPSVSCDDEDFQFWEQGDEDHFIDPDELLAYADSPVYAPAPALAPPKKELLGYDDDPPVIREGDRNNSLFKFASGLRALGITRPEIERMLHIYNERCDVPLSDWEINLISRQAARYSRGSSGSEIDDFYDLGEWVPTPDRTPKVACIPDEVLAEKDLPELNYVVKELITQGLTLLVAPPKFGKSWMCLDIALSVATGTEFLGLPTKKCGVLYLALEDGERRLKDRSAKVRGDRPPTPDVIYKLNISPLDNGFFKELDQCRELYPGIGLIIIDTFQKIRTTQTRSEGAYAYDYRDTGAIKKYADEHGLCIVLVHHTNKKANEGDVFNLVNGTSGITGSADSTIVLHRNKRMEAETRMSMVGREIEQREVLIAFDRNTYRWQRISDTVMTEENRLMLECHRDPCTIAVENALDLAEDMREEDESDKPVSYAFTAQELLDECKRLFGAAPYETSKHMGRHIKELIPMWEQYMGWTCFVKRTNSRREFIVTRKRE